MDQQPEPRDDDPVRTGVPRVDAVLAAVEHLEDRPVQEHPAVFEDAHEQLRRALDDRPVAPPVPQHLRPS